jgi:hypothetical protein
MLKYSEEKMCWSYKTIIAYSILLELELFTWSIEVNKQ